MKKIFLLFFLIIFKQIAFADNITKSYLSTGENIQPGCVLIDNDTCIFESEKKLTWEFCACLNGNDKEYLIKCEKYYKKHHINYYGYVFNEKDFKYKINNLIKRHNPDIIVLTGHDAYYKNKEYKNSKYFVETVKEIRNNYDKSIVIISGACQSDFYNLIKTGSTFASSPNHINIHALDPAIIASNIALYSEKEDVNLKELLNKTKYGPDGIGGINTKGKMKTGYPRINNKQ